MGGRGGILVGFRAHHAVKRPSAPTSNEGSASPPDFAHLWQAGDVDSSRGGTPRAKQPRSRPAHRPNA